MKNWFDILHKWKMLRIAICDDDQILCAKLADCLCRDLAHKGGCLVDQYHNGEELIHAYQEKQKAYDIIILDIDMPLVNGLDAGKQIRLLDDVVEIIILTNYSRYALLGYEIQPFFYLLKPVDEKKLLDLCIQIQERISKTHCGFLDMEIPGSFIHVPYSNILFLESERQRAHIHLTNRTISVYKKLSEILPLLDGRFAQTHKSFIVNFDFIKDINQNYTDITLIKHDTIIPISRRMKKYFIENLKEYIHGSRLR